MAMDLASGDRRDAGSRAVTIRQRVVCAAAAALPAVLTGALVLAAVREYTRPIQVAACTVYLAASLALGALLAPRRDSTAPQVGLRCALAGAIAWGLALVVMGVLSLTPLCVGQDNGDGTNDLGLCVLQVVATALAVSPIEAVLIAMASTGGALLLAAGRRAP